MANRRKAHLDALERRLTGPKRIGLFGHRNVGKTTLLAMFYRQASTGQVPGLRMAAADPASAEYLAEKIGQIESGEPPAGTLAETELKLHLYHDSARFDLIVKDYQGEHVTLGSEEPIQAFFADCDAVLLCLDPEGPASPADRTRRQQEIENLLERYIDRSDDATTGRPIALLLTKFDRVLAMAQAREGQEPKTSDDPSTWGVERLVDARYGMTRYALAQHAPGAGIFAVSAYGRGAEGSRPPAELHPLGLERPLVWLAEQLEVIDRDQLEWIWDLVPEDYPRLARCVDSFTKRYPKSSAGILFRDRLKKLRAKRRKRLVLKGFAGILLGACMVAGYDVVGFRNALAFERHQPAPAVARRWSQLLTWHPTLPWIFPTLNHRARVKEAEWTVKAAETQVALGTDSPDLHVKLANVKEQIPRLVPAIRKVEEAKEQARHDQLWAETRSEALAPGDQPEKPLQSLQTFLRSYSDTPHRDEALALAASLKARIADRESAADRHFLDDLDRSERLPNADLRDLIDRARQFLSDHPQSEWRSEVEQRLNAYVVSLDTRDIDRARQYSRQYPTNFATRIERYQDYLKAHQSGGRFISEATEARDRILRQWDTYIYRQAFDHLAAHPDDVTEVARRLRDYLRDHPEGRFAKDARDYIAWWEKVSAPGEYRVTLRRGEVDSNVGKYFTNGPDLSVTIEVAGITYGPSPIVPNNRQPIWDYTFSRPIRWKLGDPVLVKVKDHDWSDSTVIAIRSRKGDPLAIRNLSGPLKPSTGAKASLLFSSTFRMPRLTQPD